MLSRKKIIEINDIEINQEQLEKIRKYKKNLPSHWNNSGYLHLMHTTAGGVCCVCMEMPTKKVSYRIGKDEIMIEKYCDNCLHKIKDNLDGISEKVIIKYKK